MTVKLALLGFLPWKDPARAIAVDVNPSALAAEASARAFERSGVLARFFPIEVSERGIRGAQAFLERERPTIAVAVGQTRGAPRVERFGRVPGAWATLQPSESAPWLLAPDAEGLARHLSVFREEAALLEPFSASDDAGGYYCDHLCVEMARWSRDTGSPARFLHVTAIDGLSPETAAARLRVYERQIAETVHWLVSHLGAARPF